MDDLSMLSLSFSAGRKPSGSMDQTRRQGEPTERLRNCWPRGRSLQALLETGLVAVGVHLERAWQGWTGFSPKSVCKRI